MSKRLSTIIFITAIIAIGLLAFIGSNNNYKYAYATRHNIEYKDGKMSFDLYCYKEKADGSINKDYIASYVLYSVNEVDLKYIETSQCKL